MESLNRRVFCGSVAATSLTASDTAAAAAWNAGPVRHILPAASHDAIRLKTSFSEPLRVPPVLELNGRRIAGQATAPGGRHWRFEGGGLRPNWSHSLRITAGGQGATDRWSLRTTPAPDARPGAFRLLAFTCAGGDEEPATNGRRAHIPLTTRQALLQRGLSFAPDAVLAIGDHVYWDQESGLRRNNGQPSAINRRIGMLSQPADSAANLQMLATVGDRQIASLYGAALRSTPVWFVRDDHDYFENDEFYGERGTFPASPLNRGATQQLQAMFWPEFLPDVNRPGTLPGVDCSFGTMRWGRLFEGLLYDCRGYLTVDADSAAFVPPAAEAWLAGRTGDADIRHVMQVPSTPWGWSAGKWGEWYPDALGADGKPAARPDKPGWRAGWFEQHQRLLALAGSRGRDSLVASGDLHAVGAARIRRSGGLTPQSGVHSILTGPLGVDDLAFPSSFRGTAAFIPADVDLETHQAPLEKTGFTILDFAPQGIRIRQFAWRSPSPLTEIAGLQPILDKVIETRA
ncbi:hypothetical protein [Phenylobacterium sp.]|uniref:hypothetical protein n=1 Tax=Phenylobacterium sp. TaxID=1871053 RepID=UPI0039834507